MHILCPYENAVIAVY